jgi:plasmid stability protein
MVGIMGDIRVRNLDDKVVMEFKERARRHGRSLEAELRDFITSEAFRPRRELLDDLERFSETLQAKHGLLPDSTPHIREERDRRG